MTKSEIMQSERSISLLNLFHQNLQSEFIKVLSHPLLYSPEWWLSLSKKTLLIYSWRVEGGIWKRTNVKSKLRISRDSHLCGNTLPVFLLLQYLPFFLISNFKVLWFFVCECFNDVRHCSLITKPLFSFRVSWKLENAKVKPNNFLCRAAHLMVFPWLWHWQSLLLIQWEGEI